MGKIPKEEYIRNLVLWELKNKGIYTKFSGGLLNLGRSVHEFDIIHFFYESWVAETFWACKP